MKRVLLALLMVPAIASAQTPRRPAAPASRAPKLVVVLVVDQMRADYVDRFGHNWTGGFKRLMDEGARFAAAAQPYLTTMTCVGHATIATGSLPFVHGIVGNRWWNDEAGQAVPCVADPDAALVSYGAPAQARAGTSTRNLLVPTLADELRVQSSVAPRIVTLSLKDDTATMLAGRRADLVLWFDASARTFVTSSAYSKAPAPSVAQILASRPVEADSREVWTKLLPESAYEYADDAAGEKSAAHRTNHFPHPLDGEGAAPDADFYERWQESPFSDRYLGRLAEAAIDACKLGQGAGTDYLAISFSALDLVGHAFGPRSHEVQDVLARLDVTLGSLIAHLDRTVGRNHYVLALTGDHGVAPIPEQMVAEGLSGGRIAVPALLSRIEAAIQPMLGPGKHVARIGTGDLHFMPGVYARLQANPDAMRAALDAVRSTPGILRVFRTDELPASPRDEDAIARSVLNTFHPGRSGELIIVPRQYWLFESAGDPDPGGTTHGGPYRYDQNVPLLMLGHGIARGTYNSVTAPMDIAPTFAYLCGITLPAANGRVLSEALTTAARTRTTKMDHLSNGRRP